MSRYLPLTDEDRQAMLAVIGVSSIDALFRDVPDHALLEEPVDLPHGQGEMEVEAAFIAFAVQNAFSRASMSAAPEWAGST